jgi:hypothetical protein
MSHFAPPRNPLFLPDHPQRKTCRSREGQGRPEEVVNEQSENRKRRLKNSSFLVPTSKLVRGVFSPL